MATDSGSSGSLPTGNTWNYWQCWRSKDPGLSAVFLSVFYQTPGRTIWISTTSLVSTNLLDCWHAHILELKFQLLQAHPFGDRAVFNQVQHLEKQEPPLVHSQAFPTSMDSKVEEELRPFRVTELAFLCHTWCCSSIRHAPGEAAPTHLALMGCESIHSQAAASSIALHVNRPSRGKRLRDSICWLQSREQDCCSDTWHHRLGLISERQ